MTATCTPPASTTAATEAFTSVKPRYAVSNGNESYVVRVELPGVPKNAVSIDFDKSVLTIKSARKSAVPDSWKPLHRELNDLGYTLRLKLDAPVDEEKLNAQLTDGVLTLTLPIREAAKPRRIEVN